MKKITIVIISSLFLLNSCSEDETENQTFSLVGTWQPSREIVISGSNGVTISNNLFTGCYTNSTFNFKADNTLVTNIFESDINSNCVSSGIETVSYSYNHEQKSLVIDNENIEVISRTTNEIQFVDHYEDKDGDNIDDKIVYAFVKI